jgi:transcriptional regulator with XRE-family HTH domain
MDVMAKRREPPGVVEQLREAIRGSGKSLYQLGTASGVGRDRLSRFMRGQRDLTFEAVEKLCRVLGLGLTPRRPHEGP